MLTLGLGGSVGYAQDDEAPVAAAAAVVDEGAEQTLAAIDPDYNRELRTVEEQVNGLKERVFRSKATLQLLKEIVIQGASTGSRATIWHVNKLGRSYNLESVSYYLDGQGKFSKADPDGSLNESREFKVFDGAIPPGEHSITVNAKLRGNGLGIFSYVENYELNFKANTNFIAEEGKNCQIQVVMEKRKGVGRSFTERPNVSFETRCVSLQDESGAEE